MSEGSEGNFNRYEYGGESEEEASVDEEIYPPERKLRLEGAMRKLSVINKTEAYNSYAYVKISATDMKLTNIDVIFQFKYLLFIDVSGNNLKLEALQIITMMKFIILLQADRNLIRSAALDEMEYLQVLLLNENSIRSCEGINQPLLNTLELRKNKISAINFDYPLTLLRTLDLSYNTLRSITNLSFKSLESLYLAGNQIATLSGLEILINLKRLHLRSNPIYELDYFSDKLTKLKYLNFRSCRIDTMDEFKKLKVLPALEVIVITDCPLMEEKEEEEASMIRSELVAIVRTITRVNKMDITEEERNTANEIRQGWEEEEAMDGE